MTTNIGDQATAHTPHGDLTGRVVGTEDRDTSRGGTGMVVRLLCIAVDDSDPNGWRWIPADQVISCTPDPTLAAVSHLIDQVGRDAVRVAVDQVA